MEFSHELLREVTNNFLETKENGKIGEGGFGPVFVADLHFTKVAIKLLRLKNQDDFNVKMANDQFRTEVNVLTKYRHPNLVTLIGFSRPGDGSCPCLVYEYMTNGNLEEAISPHRPAHARLNYRIRLDVAMDAARALVFLHMALPNEPLVHRDVKSANILLDKEFNAKVGDFGLARAIGRDGHGGKTTKVMGTSGYIAPEYLHGEISEMIDVYAFGVVLFEILTSLPSFDNRRQRGPSLVMYLQDQEADLKDVWRRHCDRDAAKWPPHAASAVAALASLCLQSNPRRRPTMVEILLTLKEIKMSQPGQEVESDTLRKLLNRQPEVVPLANAEDKPLAIAEKATEPLVPVPPHTPDTPRPFQEQSLPNVTFPSREMVFGRDRLERAAFVRPPVGGQTALPACVEEEMFPPREMQSKIDQPESSHQAMVVSDCRTSQEESTEQMAVQVSQPESGSGESRDGARHPGSYVEAPFLLGGQARRTFSRENYPQFAASRYHDRRSALGVENSGQSLIEQSRRSPSYLTQGGTHNGTSEPIISQPEDEQDDRV